MSTAIHSEPTTAVSAIELSRAVELLTGISDSLSTSYARLSEHARRVEDELVVANGALAAKVAELDAMRSHLEGILEALPMGVVVRDADGRVVRANSAVCSILDCDHDELLGRGENAQLQGARADGEAREQYRRDGGRSIVAERSSPITGLDGRSGASVQILDDRTELVELVERVHKLDKMAALGTMAGGIAHEIRNPMNAMLGFAELLKRELPQHSRGFRYASRISEGVVEADAIITNLLSLASPEKLHLETLDAREIVEQAFELTRRGLPSEHDASSWKLTHDVPSFTFVGDRVKLRQALRNLAANAVQAQRDGGAVHVALERGSNELAFHVTDHGPGIPADVRRRLGDPFFTTRAEGTGLGLALVHTIAELHGGRVHVCPHPPTCPRGQGRGAHVVFRIPQLPTEKQ